MQIVHRLHKVSAQAHGQTYTDWLAKTKTLPLIKAVSGLRVLFKQNSHNSGIWQKIDKGLHHCLLLGFLDV